MNKALKKGVWWILFLICCLYSGYALEMALLQLYSLVGIEHTGIIKNREAPISFFIHSLFGAIGLLSGVLQFNSKIIQRSKKIHRVIGGTYLISIWLTSISAFWSALFFDVPLLAKILFCIISVLWFAITTMAVFYIKRKEIQKHINWMKRSFSITFFFITFSFWVPLFLTFMSADLAWPIGLLFSVGVNLIIIEMSMQKWFSKSISITTK